VAEVLLKTKPRDRIHIIKHDKNHATGHVFYFGGARNPLPLAYEKPAPNNTNEMGGGHSPHLLKLFR